MKKGVGTEIMIENFKRERRNYKQIGHRSWSLQRGSTTIVVGIKMVYSLVRWKMKDSPLEGVWI